MKDKSGSMNLFRSLRRCMNDHEESIEDFMDVFGQTNQQVKQLTSSIKMVEKSFSSIRSNFKESIVQAKKQGIRIESLLDCSNLR